MKCLYPEFFISQWSLILQGLNNSSRVKDYGLRTIQPGSLSSKVPAVSPPGAATPSQAGATMPQQLLITPATEATWVKLKEVSLWEDVTKMFGGEGENRQSWKKGWSLGDNLGERRSTRGSCLCHGGQGIFVKEMLGSYLCFLVTFAVCPFFSPSPETIYNRKEGRPQNVPLPHCQFLSVRA